jgi:restriction system protein
MAVPDYQAFMRPLLALAADGQEHGIRDAINRLADQFKLSEDDRSLLLPSGLESVLTNRVSWAKTYLNKAGALEKTKRAHFRITGRGKELLAQYPDRIDSQVLKQFPEFVKFQQPSPNARRKDELPQEAVTSASGGFSSTPEDAIQWGEEEISRALRSNLLSRIRELSPTFFERLVVDLIVAMGYGGSREYVAQAVGRSGDEGIDGIVNEDVLGLDRVYIQAKRYAEDNTIGREKLQQFAGALAGHAASKGVYFTTSSFAKTAVEYAQKVQQRIILIDGDTLTKLMVQYNVGVRVERTIALKRIDLDYFEEVSD